MHYKLNTRKVTRLRLGFLGLRSKEIQYYFTGSDLDLAVDDVRRTYPLPGSVVPH